MKEVLGIFAAIAAVAGIASVVSKEDEKEEAKQRQREQELELEERRLTVEAAQRKHIQQMEQQRLQMEQEKRDYQMKLANAPKKPIYKTVASLQCPLCMGHREVNEAAGEVHCPYCGATEQLEVDHYEIDQAAFQKQLQEAEQQRAAQEALEQRNERLNTAIKIVACVMGVALLILLISPIVGIAFFVPPFLLFCFLLYKRFPEKGGKVWNAIKFPLACIFVFPLPLTALFMGSEKMEERFSKKTRIGMSIGAWGIYAALVCFMGGLYVKELKNAVNQTEITQYEVAESSESEQGTQKNTAQQQSQNNTTKKNTSEQTTTTSNEIDNDIQIPGEKKEQLEFFDNSTNTVVNIGGVSVSIPSIWYENEKQKSESSHFFTDNNGKIRIGSLGLYSCKIQSDATTIEELKTEYQKYRDGFLKAALRTMPSNLPLYSIEYNDITGYFTFTSGIMSKQVNDKDIEVDCYLTILYNPVDHQFITIVMSEFQSSKESYLNDYAQIIDSVRLSSDEAGTNTSDELEAMTETTVEVEETSQIVRINMDDLEKEREENAAAAKSKYKGQCIEVVGRVGNIDSDLDFISILSPTDSWDIVGVHCSLVNDDVKEKVKTLKVDQTVIVRGTITDVGEILGYYMDAEDIIIGAPLKTL
ncbi:MAG: hypothetical protein IJM46_14930 [Oscillospiraceae bacterium]|nr:hypothetical protein [Oscillospiraceae bacterium]